MMTKERFVHYKVGVQQLDEEHWYLCQMMDKAVELSKERNNEAVISMIKEIRSELALHFASEEAMMVSSEFPWLKSHVESHQAMLKGLDKMIGMIDTNENYLCLSFARDIESMFVNHIDYADMQYSSFIAPLVEQQTQRF